MRWDCLFPLSGNNFKWPKKVRRGERRVKKINVTGGWWNTPASPGERSGRVLGLRMERSVRVITPVSDRPPPGYHLNNILFLHLFTVKFYLDSVKRNKSQSVKCPSFFKRTFWWYQISLPENKEYICELGNSTYLQHLPLAKSFESQLCKTYYDEKSHYIILSNIKSCISGELCILHDYFKPLGITTFWYKKFNIEW